MIVRRWRAALAASFLMFTTTAASAAPKPVEALLGRYAFDLDRKHASGCIVTLNGQGRNSEYGFTISDECRATFPVFESFRGWAPRDGGFIFLYRAGGIALEAGSTGLTDYSVSLRQGGTVAAYYTMARYPDRPEDLRRLRENLASRWQLWARPEDGAPSCEIRLVAGEELLAQIPPDCATIVPAAMRITAWTIDHPWSIALLDKGGGTVLAMRWLTYGTYGAPDGGPALTRLYGP